MRLSLSYTLVLPDDTPVEAMRADVRGVIDGYAEAIEYEGASSLDETFTAVTSNDGEVVVEHVEAGSEAEARAKRPDAGLVLRGKVERPR